jgi:glutaredoxin
MNFTIYSKDGCPYCEKVKQVMTLTNLSHVVYNLEDDFTREDFYGEFGQGSTFPQVICDDTGQRHKIGGCTETVEFLREKKIV